METTYYSPTVPRFQFQALREIDALRLSKKIDIEAIDRIQTTILNPLNFYLDGGESTQQIYQKIQALNRRLRSLNLPTVYLDPSFEEMMQKVFDLQVPQAAHMADLSLTFNHLEICSVQDSNTTIIVNPLMNKNFVPIYDDE